MKAASLKEIKMGLQALEPEAVQELCLRLARFKKESKELLTYLLFESAHEAGYIASVKEDMSDLFKEVPKGNVYFIKKSLRKILRFMNRQIKYSGIRETEVELRIGFCEMMKEAKIPMHENTILHKIYYQQLEKITTAIIKLPEDIKGDYQREAEMLR